jgi:CBS domain containing-hemolysin-like protein
MPLLPAALQVVFVALCFAVVGVTAQLLEQRTQHKRRRRIFKRLRKFGYYWAALLLLGAVVLVVLPMVVSSIQIEL